MEIKNIHDTGWLNFEPIHCLWAGVTLLLVIIWVSGAIALLRYIHRQRELLRSNGTNVPALVAMSMVWPYALPASWIAERAAEHQVPWHKFLRNEIRYCLGKIIKRVKSW